jgi:putative transposase
LWQHRYWEHAIRDERDFARHVEYIHFNPVKHGLASSAMEWPYSSFRRYVRNGIYPAEWGNSAMDFDGIGHE